MQSFNEDVIEASRSKPVLVDFWAPWCGPCRILGPVLDRVVDENSEKVTLVKVNTDENPGLSQQYGIRGIPAVKLFVNGDVSAEFTGALPEHEVKRWLEAHLPTESKRLLDEAAERESTGDLPGAIERYESALEADGNSAVALANLARLKALADPMQAQSFIQKAIELDASYVHLAEPIQTLARLVSVDPDELDQKSSAAGAYIAAIDFLKQGNHDKSIEMFMEALRADRFFDDDGSRKACVALFNLLGPSHEVTQKHRRTFDMLLY